MRCISTMKSWLLKMRFRSEHENGILKQDLEQAEENLKGIILIFGGLFMAIHTKTSKAIYNVLRFIIGRWLTKRFNLLVDGKEVAALKPPYLILANHTNFWDPFFVACWLPEPVYFVTSDEYFRHPFLRMALKLVRAIPKSKFIADSETVRAILKVKKAGGVVGVFPEGKRNWDGGAEPIVYSTSKLIKTLKTPVVVALLKGAHLSKPRWARKSRRGQVLVSYQVILTPEEITQLTVDEIYTRVSAALAYDEYKYQEQVKIPFKGGRLAENLELFLFICPQCQRIGTMESKGDQFFCNYCGYRVAYDEYGYFHRLSPPAPQGLNFHQPQEWNRWQLALLQAKIAAWPENSQPLLEDKFTLLLRGLRLKPLKKLHTGHLRLFPEALVFVSLQGVEIRFDLAKINGLNVQYNNKLEFYYENSLYRFIFRPRVSAYKWTKGIELVCALKTNDKGDIVNE